MHLDDLTRNFALNLGSGLKCTAYYRNKKKRSRTNGGGGEEDESAPPSKDMELLGLGRFLELLATNGKEKFDDVDFRYWQDYVNGKRTFQKKE